MIAPQSTISMKKLNCSGSDYLEPTLIVALKVEESFFLFLKQIHKHLKFFVNVLCKLRCFFIKCSNCLVWLPVVPNKRLCGLKGRFCSKMTVCLQLAYPSTIYNCFSLLSPLKALEFSGRCFKNFRFSLPEQALGCSNFPSRRWRRSLDQLARVALHGRSVKTGAGVCQGFGLR